MERLLKSMVMQRLRPASSGFTMIELIAVLIILGVLAAVAVSRFQGTDQVSLVAASARLRVHLRQTQLLAMNTNAAWYVQFSGTTYSLNRSGGSANPVSFPGEDGDSVNLGAGFGLTTGGGSFLSFDSWGRPCTDINGTSLQSGSRSITLSKGGASEAITITEDTGFIP